MGLEGAEKNRTLPDASAREKWILAVMAVITLWMGIGSPYFTRRFAAPSQNVLDQMQRNFPQDASTSGHDFSRAARDGKMPALASTSGHDFSRAERDGKVPALAATSGHDFSRAVRDGKVPALAAEGLAVPVPAQRGEAKLLPSPEISAVNTKTVIPSAARDLLSRSAQQPTAPERLSTRP